MTRVLVVDDEPSMLRALHLNLTARAYEVVTAEDGTAALNAFGVQEPDVIVLDLGLPDIDGRPHRPSYLRIYMGQLRKELEQDPSRPRHLLTEPGMGYRFVP